jgi:gamma-glutamyltranspeptidase / glutathione hydrolase
MKRPLLCIVVLLAWAVAMAQAAAPLPAWARHGMVSSDDAMVTEIGVQVLKSGGNAVDAAAAVALALGVTEGYASGIGGGCFILIRMADGTAVAIDGRETAPAASQRLMFVPRDTTKPSNLSTEGVLAVATPGELAALELAVRTYGRLPFARAFDGAIALADTGFLLNFRYARNLTSNADLLKRFEGTRALFVKSDTVMLSFGDRLVQHDLAATLRRIQAEGITAFYSGDFPKKIESYMKVHGGALAAKDFASYQPIVREPLRGAYHNYEVLSMPPPSSGGICVMQILNLLEPYNLRHLGKGSSESIHLIAEAMQLAFADRAQFLGDPRFTAVPTTGLISRDYAAQRRRLIDRVQHRTDITYGQPPVVSADASEEIGHTTHFCVVDSFGNAVSLTATVNTPFGSGIIVPGTGVILNDEMDDFVTWPGKPNYFGLVGNKANEVEPGKRPLSSMAPTILVKDNKPFMVVGSMGGPRIITSVALAILNALDYDMTIQEAVDFPRFHEQWVPDQLYLEPEYPFDVVFALKERGHKVASTGRWSAANAVMTDTTNGGWWGASDSRVQGLAKGF